MFSFSRYATVLAIPGIRGAFLASIPGRLPIGMAGLSLLLLTQSTGASYAASGLVTGVYVTGLAILAPILGRLIDRLGPRPVLRICGVVYPTTLALLTLAIRSHLPPSIIVSIAACAGASLPPITVSYRALLRRRLDDDNLIIAALSLDAVLIEFTFIAGPLLVAVLITVASPVVAIPVAAACGLASSILFLRSSALSDWTMGGAPGAPESIAPESILGELRTPGLHYLLITTFGYAIVFGLVEIALTAYAANVGQPALAGVLLGLTSIGSALAGLAYGSRNWHHPLGKQMSASLVLMGLGIVPLALLDDPSLFML